MWRVVRVQVGVGTVEVGVETVTVVILIQEHWRYVYQRYCNMMRMQTSLWMVRINRF